METSVFYSAAGNTVGLSSLDGLSVVTYNNLSIMADADEPTEALIGLTLFDSIIEASRSGRAPGSLLDCDPSLSGLVAVSSGSLFEEAATDLEVPMLSICGNAVARSEMSTRVRNLGAPGRVTNKQIEKYMEVISALPESVEGLLLRCKTMTGAKIDSATWGSVHPTGLVSQLGASIKELTALWGMLERICRTSVRTAHKINWAIKSGQNKLIRESLTGLGHNLIADYETIKGLLVDFLTLATPAIGLDLSLKTHMKSSASWYVAADVVEDLQARTEMMSITLGELASIDLQLISSLKWTLERIRNA